jgi:hypothetical protein
LRAFVVAGIGVARAEIDKQGKIVVVAGNAESADKPEEANEWDRA